MRRLVILMFLIPSVAHTPVLPKQHHGKVISPKEVECLAGTIWAESRGESVRGMLAVGHVVLNRAKAWDKQVCEVVKQPRQFSFWRKGYKWNYNEEHEAMARELLQSEAEGTRRDFLNGILHYSRVNVHKVWMKAYMVDVVIGSHKFLRKREGT